MLGSFGLIPIDKIDINTIMMHKSLASLEMLYKMIFIENKLDKDLLLKAIKISLDTNVGIYIISKVLLLISNLGEVDSAKEIVNSMTNQIPHLKDNIMTYFDTILQQGVQQGKLEGKLEGKLN